MREIRVEYDGDGVGLVVPGDGLQTRVHTSKVGG